MPGTLRSSGLRLAGRLLVAVLLVEIPIRLVLLVPWVLERITFMTMYDRSAEVHWYYQWLPAVLEHGTSAVARDGQYDRVLGWLPGQDMPDVTASGFRRTRPEGALPHPGATRVTLVGDSFTYGTEVDWDQTLGAVLEARRHDVAVTNLGVWAYGHDQMLLRYEREADTTPADIVVLVAITADLIRNRHTFFAFAKPWFDLEDGVLIERGVPVPTPSAVALRTFLRPRTLDLIAIAAQRRVPRTRGALALMQEGERRAAPILDRWAAAVRAHGAVPVVLSLPTPYDLDEGMRSAGPSEAVEGRDFFQTWCAAQDFPCVDGWDRFGVGVHDGSSLRALSHWNAAGHALAADALEDALVQAGLLPPRPSTDSAN